MEPGTPVATLAALTRTNGHRRPDMSKDEIPVSPICGWTAGAVPRMELFMLRFQYLVHSMQPLAKPNESPTYALTAMQLRELIEKMQQGLQTLESTEPQAPPFPRH